MLLQDVLNLLQVSACASSFRGDLLNGDTLPCTFRYFINGVQSIVTSDLGLFTDVSFDFIFVQAYNYALTNPTNFAVQNDYNYDVFWRNFHVNKGQYSALTAATLASVQTTHHYAGNFTQPN